METRYLRNDDFIFRKIVEEMILVPMHRDVADMNSIYTLNHVGALIWECLSEPLKPSEIAKSIIDQYDMDYETVTTDVETFLAEMLTIGAVKRE